MMANMFSLSLPVGVSSDALSAMSQPLQLDKMLADERVRSEQHKNIYQKLKTEHQRLQDQYLELETQLKATTEEKKNTQDRFKAQLEQSRADLHVKQIDCERLREQVMSKTKMDMLRAQLLEELEEPYRAKWQQLGQEAEGCRSQYNQLKYEYTFLKAEFEHERGEHQRVVDEIKMLHEKETTNLRREREILITKNQTGGSTEAHRMRTLARDNAQLHLKMKGLLSELDEVRAQNEHQGLQSDHVTRLQVKQLAETTTSLKASETERESLKLHVDSLQRELSSSTDEQSRSTTRVHELEKDAVQLKSRADEVTHRSKVEMATLKMDLMKERGELERERDRQHNQIEELTCQVETLKLTCENYTQRLDEKEREMGKSLQVTRAEEWQKQHSLENENLELEGKLQETSRRRIDDEQQLHKEREKMEGRMKELMTAKEVAEKEALVARTKLQHQQSLTDQLEHEHSENSELRVRLHRIETQYTNYVNSEQELNELNERLTTQVERLSSDLERVEKDLSVSKLTAADMMMENKTSWTNERLELQTRISELDDALVKSTTRLTNFVSAEKHKKKKVAVVLKKLKSRNKMLQAKQEQLETENMMLKRSVVPNADKLKKQLRDLWRRHQEFSSIILSGYKCNGMVPGNGMVPPGTDIDFTSIAVPYKSPSIPNCNIVVDSLSVQQKDLEQLKERLDQLDDNQRHQLHELRGFQDCVLSETGPVVDSSHKDSLVTPRQ